MRKLVFLALAAALAAGCARRHNIEDAEKALANGDYAEAAAQLKAAAKAHPSSVPLLYNLATAQSLAGDSAAAIASFRDVLRFTPGDLDASEALAAELRKGGSATQLGESHELLEFVIGYREGEEKARALNSLALTEMALHRDDLALARLLAARDAAPDYAPTHYNYALLCARDLNLPAVAMAQLDAFIAAAPDKPELLEAARTLREALAAKPAPDAQEDALKRGSDAYVAGDFADAATIFTGSVIPAKPDDPLGLRFATFAYAQQQRYYEAKVFGVLYLAAARRADLKAKLSGEEAWLAKLPETRFKP